MKRILQIDGGGLRGIIPAIVCRAIEAQVGKPIYEIFDLITGTSTGSVIGGVLAAGVPAATVEDLYLNKVPKFFTPRPRWNPANWLPSKWEKYDRKPFVDTIQKHTNLIGMGAVKTDLILTAFNLCSDRTHFISSKDICEEHIPLWKVIGWSALSAAAYFGKIDEPRYRWTEYKMDGSIEGRTGAVFQDGGQGTQNCTLLNATIEAIARGWLDEGFFILSIGTGACSSYMRYKKADDTGLFGQVADYLSQARGESTPLQVLAAAHMRKGIENKFDFCRLDCLLPNGADKLDGVKYVKVYKEKGIELATKIPVGKLA